MEDLKTKKWLSKVFNEVEKHKWYESERIGVDVGWPFAADDWLKKHFDEWNKGHSASRNGDKAGAAR